jgi:tetratricopeptide (TPR) repeat protein
MIDPNKKEPLPISPSEVCNRAFELMASKQFNEAERLLAGNMSKTDDDIAVGLYHSTLGVLYKMKGEFKTAWRHYQRAEKLIPKDPALKIISARLLIDQFAEYDQAIKKSKKVLELAKGIPAFEHQAYTTMGLAWVRRGNRKKATAMLQKSMCKDFENFISAQNIDFNLVEALLRKGWAEEECRDFLTKAQAFAQEMGEDKFVKLFDKMLTAFESEFPRGDPDEVTSVERT